MKIVIVGGGAAGFFAALACKKKHPSSSVVLYEKTAKLLSKVRISGGGRCNVTHACFDPKELVKSYPRGAKELLGAFYRFQPKDTIQWFLERGVELKVEPDGRIFPITDSSQTIIDCFLKEAEDLGVEIKLRSSFNLKEHEADRLILATGSSKEGWEMAKHFGHTIQPPVPSLFTFNIANFAFESLAGISLETARLQLQNTKLSQEGPLLITHWGFSGPAALKLSAFGARVLAENHYEMALLIDFLPQFSIEELVSLLLKEHPSKQLKNIKSIPLPKRLWHFFCEEKVLGKMSKKEIFTFFETIKKSKFQIHGKTTNKEEFVTCGGITLSEVDFKTMQSKLHPGLYFCGEILDIDGVTGGFNFQNAWTTAWIAAQNSCKDS